MSELIINFQEEQPEEPPAGYYANFKNEQLTFDWLYAQMGTSWHTFNEDCDRVEIGFPDIESRQHALDSLPSVDQSEI